MAPLVTELFNTIGERIKATARVETIYGETRVVEGRTVIPVAEMRYAFGGGAGQGPKSDIESDGEAPGGGGGGGAVSVSPVGFLVLAEDGERFVPVNPPLRKLALAGVFGFMQGFSIAKRVHAS